MSLEAGVQIPRDPDSDVPTEDAVQESTAALGRSVPAVGRAGAEPDRRTASDAGPRTHNDFDSAEERGVGSSGVHQGQECDLPG